MNPVRLDRTVPVLLSSRSSDTQNSVVHSGEIPENAQEILFGVPATNTLRTILNTWEEGSLQRRPCVRAFQQARSNGEITKN